jgi:hypothetical protein
MKEQLQRKKKYNKKIRNRFDHPKSEIASYFIFIKKKTKQS